LKITPYTLFAMRKTIPGYNVAIKKRFQKSFFTDFYPSFHQYCTNLTYHYQADVLSEIVDFTSRFDFVSNVKDSKKKKPSKVVLSGVKAGIFDQKQVRMIRVAESVFRNIERRSTNEGWCQYNIAENGLMLKIPLANARFECWIIFFLHVL